MSASLHPEVLAFASSLATAFKLALDIIRSPRKHPWYGFGTSALAIGKLLVKYSSPAMQGSWFKVS